MSRLRIPGARGFGAGDVSRSADRSRAAADGGTLRAMPSQRPPSDEAVALARVMLEDPDDLPPDASPLLKAAAGMVRRDLDEHDRALFARLAKRKDDDPSREAFEQALAYRISQAALRLRGRAAELTDAALADESRRRG
jgi:hypothetical protein